MALLASSCLCPAAFLLLFLSHFFLSPSLPPSLPLTHVGSSDEDEDDIFSDDLVERGSDSDSGDNEQVSITLLSKFVIGCDKPSKFS